MLRVAPVAVALGLLGSAHAGFAADGWLDWSSPSALCGDASAFSARVERALGRSPALAAAGAATSPVPQAPAPPEAPPPRNMPPPVAPVAALSRSPRRWRRGGGPG